MLPEMRDENHDDYVLEKHGVKRYGINQSLVQTDDRPAEKLARAEP